jgi:hypothetical protein
MTRAFPPLSKNRRVRFPHPSAGAVHACSMGGLSRASRAQTYRYQESEPWHRPMRTA